MSIVVIVTSKLLEIVDDDVVFEKVEVEKSLVEVEDSTEGGLSGDMIIIDVSTGLTAVGTDGGAKVTTFKVGGEATEVIFTNLACGAVQYQYLM